MIFSAGANGAALPHQGGACVYLALCIDASAGHTTLSQAGLGMNQIDIQQSADGWPVYATQILGCDFSSFEAAGLGFRMTGGTLMGRSADLHVADRGALGHTRFGTRGQHLQACLGGGCCYGGERASLSRLFDHHALTTYGN